MAWNAGWSQQDPHANRRFVGRPAKALTRTAYMWRSTTNGLFSALPSEFGTHWARSLVTGGGRPWAIQGVLDQGVHSGVDQGCPLAKPIDGISARGFADDALEEIRQEGPQASTPQQVDDSKNLDFDPLTTP